jgi:hypothetical protein
MIPRFLEISSLIIFIMEVKEEKGISIEDLEHKPLEREGRGK